MPFGAIRFSVPINFALPIENGYFIDRKGNYVFINISSVKGEKIFCYTENDYRWLNSQDEAIMTLWVDAVMKDNSCIPFRRICTYKATSDALDAGVVDLIIYSIIEMVFQIPSISFFDSTNTCDSTIAWAKETFRDFVDLYLFVSQDTTIRRFDLFDSPIQLLVSDVEADISLTSPWGPFENARQNLSWPDPAKTGTIKKQWPIEKANEFWLQSSQGAAIDLRSQLLLDAKEQGHTYGNFRLSIVLTESAFEVFLQNILIEYCKVHGINELLVNEKKNIYKPFEIAIRDGNVGDLNRQVELLTNRQIKGKPAYNAWHEKVYQQRNEIVHRGKMDISDQDAKTAFENTGILMNMIVDMLFPET